MIAATAGAPTGRRAGFDLEAIKAALPIARVLELAGIEGRRSRYRCPCKPGSTSPTLSVFRDGAAWHCHRCQRGGSVLDLVTALDGLSLPDAIRRCAELAGIGPSTGKPLARTQRPADARKAAALREGRIWRETAVLRDVSQRIADDDGQPIEVRIAALGAVHDCDATLDLMLASEAMR